MAALWIAEKAGVKFQEIPLGAALAPGLRSGQVDAVVFSAMITLREIDAGQARSIIDLTRDMPPTLANVYVASQDMIDKRPQELRAALAAIYEALDHMRQNRDWTLAFLKEFAKSDNEKLNEQLYSHVIKELSTDGHIDKACRAPGTCRSSPRSIPSRCSRTTSTRSRSKPRAVGNPCPARRHGGCAAVKC
jgi:ABC-type nitrate/sulfonate/bicarbonate transport system substrate-binding protein